MRHPFLLTVFVGLTFLSATAQDINHYVVVGAFSSADNANRLSNKISRSVFKAKVDVNKARNLYYVYLHQSADMQQAYTYLMRVRVETPYKDAWIFHGRLGTEPIVATPVRKPEETKVEPVPVVVEEKPVETPVVALEEEKPAPVEEEIKPDPVAPKPPGKPFFFKLVNESTGNPITGEVQVLETAKANEYLAFESNKIVYLPAPKNKTGTWQIKTLAPGYKQSKRSINYLDPANSAASVGSSEEYVIALPLVRVKQGDYIEFSNVRFYPHTTILHPDSKNELGGLASLMKENMTYRVLIHGHCNGNEARDITTLGTSKDLFATGTGNVRENADAKKFTLLRAETVKAFLVQEGIDASRIKTKGEGGKQYIYPANSTLSARNDRVEIEIKKGK